MPPKKKGKGKGKGKKGGKGDAPAETEKPKSPEPTEKELLLKEELQKITDELENAKIKVDDLRKENDWLQTEAHKVRVESHEYMSFIEKKTSKRQTTIITLSDHNKQEIRNIQIQKQMMEEDFDDKKKALENLLLEKEHLLEKTTQELNDLQEYKDLQTEQLTKIRDLEKDVKQMRAKHSEAIQQLKSDFLKQKREFQSDSENRIHSLETKANKEALQCLIDHTNRIKVENRQLRRELLGLIQKTRVLHQHGTSLEEQKRQLLCEQQYANDLKKLRNARQHKVYKSFRLLDGQEAQDEDVDAGQ
ncbi:basal body-orientation factor 1-like [Gigantopelta aegis]|uniref:basal body-orientation factor 1-like n=1 Tax=Gigantopelta aegis TaxID=1735272 RepID=UPI001B88D8AB|nr:basal body-orientation factor 1-like [Gigantopelta aegis]